MIPVSLSVSFYCYILVEIKNFINNWSSEVSKFRPYKRIFEFRLADSLSAEVGWAKWDTCIKFEDISFHLVFRVACFRFARHFPALSKNKEVTMNEFEKNIIPDQQDFFLLTTAARTMCYSLNSRQQRLQWWRLK